MKETTLKKIKASGMRIGQVVWNAMNMSGKWEAPEANPLFFISDIELEQVLTRHFKHFEEKKDGG